MLPNIQPCKQATTKILEVHSENGIVQVPGITCLVSPKKTKFDTSFSFICTLSDQTPSFNEMNHTVKVFRIRQIKHCPCHIFLF